MVEYKEGFYETLDVVKWPITWIRCAKGVLSEISDIPPRKERRKAKVEPYENAMPRIYKEIQDILSNIEDMCIGLKSTCINIQDLKVYIDEIYNCLVDIELIYLKFLGL